MPQALTILTDIKRQHGDETKGLRSLLENLGRNLANNSLIQFDQMRTVHYAAWLILPKLEDRPARLLLETNYDGSTEQHLNDLIKYGGAALDQIYGFCEGYPAWAQQADRVAEVRRYFLNNRAAHSAYYVAFPGRSLEDIRNAIAVYEEAKEVLERLRRDNQDEGETRARLIEHFRKLSGPARPKSFPVTQRGLKRLFVLNLVIGSFVGLLALAPGLVLVAALMLWALFYEMKETGKPALGDRTDHDPTYEPMVMPQQTHLCTLATVRSNRFRRFVLRLALLIVKVAATKFFILGKLSHVSTVHFARWMLLDNHRRLVFLSNFDGSWSSYLGEFADPPWGVNLIWGNTNGYPPTRCLLERGARDLEAFEEQNARHFVPAPVFYSAYCTADRAYTVQNIKRYLEYRDLLAKVLKLRTTGASR